MQERVRPSTFVQGTTAPAPPGQDDWPHKSDHFDALQVATFAFFCGLGYSRDLDRAKEMEKLKKRAEILGYTLYVLQTDYQKAIFLVNDRAIHVVFDGSMLGRLRDYLSNGKHKAIPHSLGGRVHSGFWERLNAPVVFIEPADNSFYGKPWLEAMGSKLAHIATHHPHAPIHLMGHSSGGARAMLLAAHMMEHSPKLAKNRIETITTFGQPCFGDAELANKLNAFYGDKYRRFVHRSDPVTSLPPNWIRHREGYQHTGKKFILPPPQNEPPYRSLVMRGLHAMNLAPRMRHSIRSYTNSCASFLDFPDEEAFAKYLLRFHKRTQNIQRAIVTDATLRRLDVQHLAFDGMGRDYALHLRDLLERLLDANPVNLRRAELVRCVEDLNQLAKAWDMPDMEQKIADAHHPTEMYKQHHDLLRQEVRKWQDEREALHNQTLGAIGERVTKALTFVIGNEDVDAVYELAEEIRLEAERYQLKEPSSYTVSQVSKAAMR